MPKELIKKVKYHFSELIKMEKSPHSIAAGFAVGTFIGIIPTPGISVILAFVALLIYPKVNKISIFAAIAIWNPFLTIPLYPLSYKIGDLLFSGAPVIKFNIVLFDQVYNFSRRFLVGNIILALVISAGSYLIVRVLAEVHQHRKRQKRTDL